MAHQLDAQQSLMQECRNRGWPAPRFDVTPKAGGLWKCTVFTHTYTTSVCGETPEQARHLCAKGVLRFLGILKS